MSTIAVELDLALLLSEDNLILSQDPLKDDLILSPLNEENFERTGC